MKKVNAKQDFIKLEQDVLAFWDGNKIFEKSVKKGKKNFVFYDGPPTANGEPHIGHALTRAVKDIIPRYKTMRGYRVVRKSGWDTHGLPVELQVEKELKISGKPEIEKYGIEGFNDKCKKNVWKYKTEWEKMTKRIGFWLDMDDPYITYDPKYIESVWWILKQIWDKKLLYKDYKVVPHCPRCGTALSSHEVAQGYKKIKEESVYLKFKVKGEKDTYILSWTTTPWTLPGNVALAVGRDIDYLKVERDGEFYILAKARMEILKEGYKIVDEFKGEKLVGMEYEPLYDVGSAWKEKAYYVADADFVTVEDGTGVVHTAVMYGEDDFELGKKLNLPKHHTVHTDGTFIEGVGKWGGKFVKDVEKDIIADLKDRGLLLKTEMYEHDYPFCWRCDTPLLYYAKDSWFIKVSEIRDKLIKNNKAVNWVPSHLKKGRFGEWLNEAKDWALSRERYWGTPLPIWECMHPDCGERICVGSFEELDRLSVKKIDKNFDPHRVGDEKGIDNIILKCERCGSSEMHRVPDVIDCWFDSGAMPFAQYHYPFENKEKIDKNEQFPADYISEAVDQTRGWFYTLLVISTLLDKGPSYKNVISLGHVLDKNGKKMSKSKGNVVSWKSINDHGADALRWYFYALNGPGETKRFDPRGIAEIMRNVILRLWNTYSFFVTYALIDKPKLEELKDVPRNKMDKWIISNLHALTKEVTDGLDDYDFMNPARKLEKFLDELSNWYVRRSRRRFWKSKNDVDKNVAYNTLYTCLLTFVELIAPFAPFVSESIFQNLKKEDDPESVHLCDYPKALGEFIDEKLNFEMDQILKIIRLGRAVRDKSQIKIRQPLSAIYVKGVKVSKDLAKLIQDELNIKKIELVSDASKWLKSEVKLNFKKLGAKYGKKLKEIQSLKFEVEDDVATAGKYKLESDEFELVESAKEGFGAESENNVAVILDLNITENLKLEGIAREIVRAIQDMRKEMDYSVSDHIYISWTSNDPFVQKVFDKSGLTSYIWKETLAKDIFKEAVENRTNPDFEREFSFSKGKITNLAIRR
ncbi:MAG: hypothetical protein ACD_63C00054G0005 [uncultured bacterium]|nr:MAG: hypothetical protein ACD_63C00054G0005 [uncultured bacterium]